MRWLPIPELSPTLEGVSPATQALRISRSTRRLAQLATLPNLVSLDVQNASMELLRQVSGLSRLRHLVLEPFRLDDLAPLAELTHLRSLTLSSGGWGRVRRVRSFAPLRPLTELEYASTNLVPDDGDLSPLAASAKMRRIDLAPGIYGLADLASIAACLRPQDRTGTLSGVVQLYTAEPCARCGVEFTQVLLAGKGSGGACTACQQAKVQRHLSRWEKSQEAFRAENPKLAAPSDGLPLTVRDRANQ